MSLAQIHAAFAYYYDHQADLEAELDQRFRRVQAIRGKVGEPFSRKQLTARLKRK